METKKVWFIGEGIKIMDGKFVDIQIEHEFEISKHLYHSIIYSEEIDMANQGRLKTSSQIIRRVISPKLRWTIFQRDKFRCVKCGRGVQEVKSLEIDHIIPVTRGGDNREENLQTLCRDCNIGKDNQLEDLEEPQEQILDKEEV